ncbi:MAG: SDR family oxidoreductase [Alphaproteobacteria bacterium]|nr:SDR family oxidoreductase [Alphaproteobacteria bacterium]
MDLNLNNQHVLITGGSKGIGLACAQAFLAEGAKVTLVARNSATLNEAREQLLKAHFGAQVQVVSADLTQAQAAQQALDAAEAAWGPVDILVNSAGAAKRTPLNELTPQAWHDAMQAKFFSYIHMINPTIQRMASRRKGAVVNVIGQGGKVPSPIHLPGGAANAALMLVTAGLAAGYAEQGIRVNAVNPGLTATERLYEGYRAESRVNGLSMDELLAKAQARQPMKRLPEPSEIADAVVYLASSRASYVTGVNLTMDGAITPIVV